MIGRIKEVSYVHVCEHCKSKFEYECSKAKMKKSKFIEIPPCSVCGSMEFLYLNDKDNEHGRKASRLFAKVHKEKEKAKDKGKKDKEDKK